MKSSLILFFISLFFYLTSFQTLANNMATQRHFQTLCYEKQECSPRSLKVLDDYKKGQKMKFDFSNSYYYGVCDTYYVHSFPFGSKINVYIKKVENDYYMNLSFGSVVENEIDNPSVSQDFHSEQHRSIQIERFKVDENHRLKETNDFHYMHIEADKKSPESPSFFAWVRSDAENKSLKMFGYFFWGMYTCQADLVQKNIL